MRVIFSHRNKRSFFKDSKIVDKNGNLKTVYHNTNAVFTKFEVDKSGSNQGNTKGQGVYLSKSKTAFNDDAYGNKQMELYANITNPYKMEGFDEKTARYLIKKYDNDSVDVHVSHLMKKLSAGEYQTMDYIKYFAKNANISTIELLSDLGYDGIVDGIEVIAFMPEQIKSVDNLNPTSDPDIRYSIDTPTDIAHMAESEASTTPKLTPEPDKQVGNNESKFFESIQASTYLTIA